MILFLTFYYYIIILPLNRKSLFSKYCSPFVLCIAVRELRESRDHHGTLKDFEKRFQAAGAVDDQKRFECVRKQSPDFKDFKDFKDFQKWFWF